MLYVKHNACYVTINDILCIKQYPKWIEENKNKVEAQQMTKYREHDRIVREICVEFEAEHVSDTEDVKKLRFERIVDLMQQVKRSYLSLFCVS